MPAHCCAYNCTNRFGKIKDVTFHKFPKDAKRREEWAREVRRADEKGNLWTPSKNEVICSVHFRDEDLDRTGQTTRLRDGAKPVRFDFPSHLKRKAPQVRSQRRNEAPCVLPDCSASPEESSKQLQAACVAQDHSYQVPDSVDLRTRIDRLNQQREKLERELRNAKDREKRSRVNCLNLLQELKEKSLVTEELQIKLEAFSDFPTDLFRRPVNEYSEEQRSFALTLHLYSSKAYNYLRDVMKLPLPHPRTLSRWLETVEGKPGFNILVIKTLQGKAKTDVNYKHCTLMLDAMAVKQHVQYDQRNERMVGFVDLGDGADATEEAKEVLVIMAVGIRGHWKIPIGYFFTNTLNASAQSQLMYHSLEYLHEAGIVVSAITMDGHATNISMCRKMGCNFDPHNIKSYFLDPASQRNIFVFFDACHMLKLARNMLEAYSLLESCEGRVRWQDIKDLQKFQSECGLRAANRLTITHVQFKLMKMKVGLAAQVLSESVAIALRLVHVIKIPGFEDCLGTAKFVEVINTVFDVLNSRNLKSKGAKRPFTSDNLEEIMAILQTVRQYLMSLRLTNGTFIYSTRRFLSVVGFLVNIESLKKLMPDLLNVQTFVLTYKFSQDHLELFFSAVRNAGGFNNNPTCLQFTSVFRRLIARAGVKAGKGSNVVELDEISLLDLEHQQRNASESTLTSPFEDADAIIDHSYAAFHQLSKTSEHFINNIVVYIAGFVVRKVVKSLACDDCRASLVTVSDSQAHHDGMFHLLTLKNKGGLVVPSEGVVNILLCAEKAIRQTMDVTCAKSITKKQTLTHIVKREYGNPSSLCLNDHALLTQYGIDNHYYDLLQKLVSTFYDLRQHHVARLHSSRVSRRSKLTKLILFQGD